MEAGKKVAGTGIGAPMRRVEDRRFVTGRGDFVDDLAPVSYTHLTLPTNREV